MTIRYGSIVGAAENPANARPTMVPFGYRRVTDEVIVRDTALLAAAPIADVIHLGWFGWDSIINPDTSFLHFDALGAASTLSVGDTTYPAALNAATDTHTAAGKLNIGTAIGIGSWYQPLWKMLGYASEAAAKAIGNQCELLATIAGGAATGNVTWQVNGISMGATWQPT